MQDKPQFSKASGRGYDIAQVDSLMELARRQYDNPDAVLLRASDLRGMRLELVQGGYSVSQVDAALDNLEDYFIRAEVRAFRERFGEGELEKRFEELRQSLIPRLTRSANKRFTKTSLLSRGYNRKQVDDICQKLLAHFDDTEKVKVSEIRRVQFRSRRRGYSMPQVDSFLDRVIEALQLEISR